MKDIIIAIIGSGALSALVSGLVTYLNGRRKAKSGLDKGVRMLLLAEIKMSGSKYCSDGHISFGELESFTEMYNVYKALGGNGYAEAVKHKVEALPVEPDK